MWEASGGRGGGDTRVHLPPAQVSGRVQTDLLQPSCVGCQNVFRQLLETVGQSYFRWPGHGESLSDYRERQGSLAELLSPSGHLCCALGLIPRGSRIYQAQSRPFWGPGEKLQRCRLGKQDKFSSLRSHGEIGGFTSFALPGFWKRLLWVQPVSGCMLTLGPCFKEVMGSPAPGGWGSSLSCGSQGAL